MTDMQYAYVQERFEVYEFSPVQRGNGIWFNPKEETYSQAVDRAKKELYDKVQQEFPHLNFNQSKPEIPIYKDIVKSIPKEEDKIDKDFNVVSAINKSTTLKELRLNKYLCVLDFEKRAYDKKEQELLQSQTLQ